MRTATLPARRAVASLVLTALAGCAASPGSAPPDPTPTQRPASAAPASPLASPAASGTPTATPSAYAPATPLTGDELHDLVLLDVVSGAEFTLGQLAAERPVLVETMAIWCTNCLAQQREVVAAHESADFSSVSIDVDPTELPADLAAYAEREGFDWRFVKANGVLANLLRDRFGTGVLNPPSMPKLLLRPDGSIELLPLGERLSADELAALLAG